MHQHEFHFKLRFLKQKFKTEQFVACIVCAYIPIQVVLHIVSN